MAKSIDQIIALYQEDANLSKRAFEIAISARNRALAVQNLYQLLESLLMQGLIGWRSTSTSPVVLFREAVRFVREGLAGVTSVGAESRSDDARLLIVRYLAYLVDDDDLEGISSHATADLRLDAVVLDALRNSWNESSWNAGLTELKALRGTGLAIDTYSAYREVLLEGNIATVSLCERLFDRRRRDAFFSGGSSTEGGDGDNTITVDFRLAAIMKKVGYKGKSVHLWVW